MTNRLSRAVGLAWALMAVPMGACALDIMPTITLSENYTSNVNLDPAGEDDSEWITRIAPGVEIDYDGARLDLTFEYTLEALFYVDVADRNEIYNQLSNTALLDLIGEELQLEANASISQVNLAPEERVTSSNINTTGNRADALAWHLGPRWRRALFAGSELEGHARVGKVQFDVSETQDDQNNAEDVQSTSASMSLHTDGRTNPTVTYDLNYEYDKLDYEISGAAVEQTAYLQLGYRFNDTLQVFALGGLDSGGLDSDAENRDDSLSEPRWEVGVSSAFTADDFRISVGERYFGRTYSFIWNHTGADSSYALNYSESPTTSDLVSLRQLPTDEPGAEPEPLPPDSDLNRPGDPTRFVLKRADADASWTLYRSILSLNAFWEARTDQVLVTESPTEAAGANDETSYGMNADFSWELGSRSVVKLGVGWTHRDFNDFADMAPGDPAENKEDESYNLLASLDYTLGLRTTLGFTVGFQDRQTSSSDDTGNYDELWASVQLARTF